MTWPEYSHARARAGALAIVSRRACARRASSRAAAGTRTPTSHSSERSRTAPPSSTGTGRRRAISRATTATYYSAKAPGVALVVGRPVLAPRSRWSARLGSRERRRVPRDDIDLWVLAALVCATRARCDPPAGRAARRRRRSGLRRRGSGDRSDWPRSSSPSRPSLRPRAGGRARLRGIRGASGSGRGAWGGRSLQAPRRPRDDRSSIPLAPRRSSRSAATRSLRRATL